jgi:YidC/Oxa1 family membrane protein insertase
MPNTPMTNNLRVYLWIALALALYFNYSAWMADYGPRPETASTAATAPGAHGAKRPNSFSDEVPRAPSSSAQPQSSTPAAAAPAAAATTEADGDFTAPVVRVVTDVLDLDISTRGGTIQRVDLLKYQKVKGEPVRVRLENVDDPVSLYVLQSGLTGPAANMPNQRATFTAAQSTYQLDSSGVLRVPLTWTNDGITVTKTFVFRRGHYAINVEYNVVNHSDSAWQAAQYAQIRRNDPRTKTSMFNFNAEKSQFHGPAVWDGKYRKLDFQGADNHLSTPVKNGWIAALQHHFVTAIVPPKDLSFTFTLNAAGDEYHFAATGPLQTVPPGASQTFGETFFVGPKLQSALAATGPELARVADYGALYLLAEPLFWLLDKAHAVTGNWGVAIILITLLLKVMFYPLSEASGRSMAKMKALAPRIKNLQEMYKDEREKLGKATMELYQREKVNPVAGCLPMIIQMPVFLAFYWVLLESVEMRQAPFVGWIHDLSSKDPFYILPAIMAAAMFAQFKLNPTAADPTQQKVMMVMPLVMSVTFAFFPAGLVLYWVTNTLLSMAQQWNINRRIIGRAGSPKRA